MERTKFGGTNAHRHRMVCRACYRLYKRAWGAGFPTLWSGRYTLPKHPDNYAKRNLINCPVCGADDVRSDEQNRRREQQKKDTCNCHHIPFPHERGTILGCEDHPKDFDDWTEEDEQQFQGMLETPRSG